MALGKKTGGRKKGSRNKRQAAKAKAVADSGLTPLDFMLGVMRSKAEDPALRFEAAKAAAPYCHQRLAAHQHSGTVAIDADGFGVLAGALDRLAAAAAGGADGAGDVDKPGPSEATDA